MAFDGTIIAALTYELNYKLRNGRISKIAQPEKDELLLFIKNNGTIHKLLISANASLPLITITHRTKNSPLNAPNFCMLLRKHLSGGKILSFSQPGLERIINIEVEHLNELGDLCKKTLVVELMGKHSNIILCSKDSILDSIKHIPPSVSSIRTVLPGHPYFIPDTMNKSNPLTVVKSDFIEIIANKSDSIGKILFSAFTGISPQLSEEIIYRANLDSTTPCNEISQIEKETLFSVFADFIAFIKSSTFYPSIYYENKKPLDFSAFAFQIYSNLKSVHFEDMSSVLELYYSEKDLYTRIRQKSSDLRQIVNSQLQKNYKKYDLQLQQLKDTEKKDKYRLYGELLTTYGYSLPDKAPSITVENYYDGKEITIPLSTELTPMENANKYFNRYTKFKRTFDALSKIIPETKGEIEYLESVRSALELSETEEDLNEIKEELIDSGYIHRKKSEKRKKIINKPLHFISSDGFHMYVGKNNNQNDEITFRLATGNDWWFHAQKIPGSHVIVKSEGKKLPDKTFEEAARLAAFYSKGRDQEKVEVDYIEKKHIKKPGNSKPGFVIYHTNYSMAITPDIKNIEKLQ